MRLMTRKQNCFNFVGTSQNVRPPCAMVNSSPTFCLTCLCSYGPYYPAIHCPQEATLFLSLRLNNFDIFSLGLIPNIFAGRKYTSLNRNDEEKEQHKKIL